LTRWRAQGESPAKKGSGRFQTLFTGRVMHSNFLQERGKNEHSESARSEGKLPHQEGKRSEGTAYRRKKKGQKKVLGVKRPKRQGKEDKTKKET